MHLLMVRSFSSGRAGISSHLSASAVDGLPGTFKSDSQIEFTKFTLLNFVTSNEWGEGKDGIIV